jgi:hypothetical protein
MKMRHRVVFAVGHVGYLGHDSWFMAPDSWGRVSAFVAVSTTTHSPATASGTFCRNAR